MNDPLLPAQWHYDNTGYQVLVTQAGADVNLFDAWKKNQGSSDIVVAVIDQAVQYTHPDLQANIWVNPNPTKGDQHGYNFVNNTAELDWSYADRKEYQGQIYYSNADHAKGSGIKFHGISEREKQPDDIRTVPGTKIQI